MAKSGKKIKKIKRVLLISVLSIVALSAFVFFFGGSGFRWFGAKTEKAGEAVKEKSGEIGGKADDIKQGMKEAAKDVKKDLVDKVTGK